MIRLKRALRQAVDGEVRFGPGSLAMYANDASNFRQVPIGVIPRWTTWWRRTGYATSSARPP